MGYELRFDNLLGTGHGYAFPCDASGVVDLDALSESARNNYFFAHASVGRDFSVPRVVPQTT